jgi:hypothetical protein
MPTDHWSEDDRAESRPVKRWRWWHVAGLGVVVLLAVFAIAGMLFPKRLAGEWINWQVRQLRQDILKGNLSPEALRDELRTRDGGHLLAQRLSLDQDPRVRAAVVETIASWGTPAKKREPNDYSLPTQSFSNSEDTGALQRLIDDSDPSVRRAALRAVCPLEEVRSFDAKILDILERGPIDERLIIAEHLAHWNGEEVRRTFVNNRQPKEVRLAAIRSTDRYGWSNIGRDPELFRLWVAPMQNDPDPELREAAKNALKQVGDAKPK